MFPCLQKRIENIEGKSHFGRKTKGTCLERVIHLDKVNKSIVTHLRSNVVYEGFNYCNVKIKFIFSFSHNNKDN